MKEAKILNVVFSLWRQPQEVTDRPQCTISKSCHLQTSFEVISMSEFNKASAFLWRYEPVRRTGKSDDWLTIFCSEIPIVLSNLLYHYFFHWIMRLLSVFYFSFEISTACWLLSRPNWRIVSKLTTDVVTYCTYVLYWGLQSKIKICVPENILLQKKHWTRLSVTNDSTKCSG